eukprot:scaffold8854_cov97-Skeletonema_dohrnii-CCMP3373.AAC.3
MEEMQFYVHFTPDKINEENKKGTLKRQKDEGCFLRTLVRILYEELMLMSTKGIQQGVSAW